MNVLLVTSSSRSNHATPVTPSVVYIPVIQSPSHNHSNTIWMLNFLSLEVSIYSYFSIGVSKKEFNLIKKYSFCSFSTILCSIHQRYVIEVSIELHHVRVVFFQCPFFYPFVLVVFLINFISLWWCSSIHCWRLRS